VQRHCLKHLLKGCWRVIRSFLAVAWLVALSHVPAVQAAQEAIFPPSLNGFKTVQECQNQCIEFTDIDIVISNQSMIPVSGWQREATNRIWRPEQFHSKTGDIKAVWGRVRFDRASLGRGPIAIYTQDNREQIMVFLNGVDIFRNFASADDITQSWYRPYLIPIPINALKPGRNEIIFRVASDYTVGVGKIVIGPNQKLQARYNWQQIVRITGPMIANYAMIILGGAALLMWVARRSEYELLFLALSAALWMVCNYHFFTEHSPVDAQLFSRVSLYSVYFAATASAGFCLTFLKIPNHRFILFSMFFVGVAFCAAHWLLGLQDILIYLATFVIVLTSSTVGLLDLRRYYTAENLVLSVIMTSFTLTSIHDVGRVANINWWQGAGFYVQPYFGFILSLAFLLSFGRRALGAFTVLGDANQTLALRITEAREELTTSEEKRRALVVDRAIVSERERLMREMHDGIGSNLVTALAIAERQHQPQTTIKLLKRAISDLKITVDSLEPVEGDMVALIANLRHRMASDLKAAGLVSKWEVGDCRPLPWLDATNALHVLRIFQEAISNVIAHSGATIMQIGCHDEMRNGVAGLRAFIADNGVGYEALEVEASGKGLSNMKARAEAMHGQFSVVTAKGHGTRLTVWFPYERGLSSGKNAY
jgi:signal transduction histidine kinase